MKNFKSFLIYFLLISLNESNDYFNDDEQHQPNNHECELISGECTDQEYKFTSSVTKLNDGTNFFESQKIADETIKSYQRLMPCSNYLKIFLCATYKPSCYEEAALIIQPCRSMCEHVFKRCYSLMNQLNIKWNTELNCSRFLDDNSDSCMKDNGYLKDYTQEDLYERVNKTKKFQKSTTKKARKELKFYQAHYDKYFCVDKEYRNKTIKFSECSLRCDSNVLFSSNEKIITRRFTLVLSILSLISSCLTIVIYLINATKYEYPNVIFVFMSFCYAIYSVVHLTALLIGRNLTSCQKVSTQTEDNFIYLGHDSDNNYCFLTLLLIYYFRMVSLIWWLVLVLSWNFIIHFNIKAKQVNKLTIHYLHYFVWILPALKCLLIVLKNQSGTMSELSGLCSVGDLDKNTLFNFLILPSGIYLLIGVFLILIGFFKIIISKNQPFTKPKTCSLILNENKKYLGRIGLIIIICSISFTIITICEVYEYLNMDSWFILPKKLQLNPKLNENEAFNFKLKNYMKNFGTKLPMTAVFVTKIFMQFLNSFILLFLLSINSKTDCFKYSPKREEFYSSNNSDSTNQEHSYQFYPPPPPPKFQNKYACACSINQQLKTTTNEYNNYSIQTSSDLHHYCTPHVLLQSDSLNCECSPQGDKQEITRKLSSFAALNGSVF